MLHYAIKSWRTIMAAGACLMAAPPPSAPYVDTFTDTAGTTLASHTPDDGGSWTRHPGTSANSQVSTANRARSSSNADASAYTWSGVPTGADYVVEADLYFASIVSGSTGAGVTGRTDTSVRTYYVARFVPPGSWVLGKWVAGSYTNLSLTAAVVSAGETHRIGLSLSSTTISLTVDGATVLTTTDASIATAGRAGIYIGSDGVTSPSDSNYIHVDNFSASFPSAAPERLSTLPPPRPQPTPRRSAAYLPALVSSSLDQSAAPAAPASPVDARSTRRLQSVQHRLDVRPPIDEGRVAVPPARVEMLGGGTKRRAQITWSIGLPPDEGEVQAPPPVREHPVPTRADAGRRTAATAYLGELSPSRQDHGAAPSNPADSVPCARVEMSGGGTRRRAQVTWSMTLPPHAGDPLPAQMPGRRGTPDRRASASAYWLEQLTPEDESPALAWVAPAVPSRMERRPVAAAYFLAVAPPRDAGLITDAYPIAPSAPARAAAARRVPAYEIRPQTPPDPGIVSETAILAAVPSRVERRPTLAGYVVAVAPPADAGVETPPPISPRLAPGQVVPSRHAAYSLLVAPPRDAGIVTAPMGPVAPGVPERAPGRQRAAASAYAALAAATPPDAGVTGLEYKIYDNDGAGGAIDYSSAVDTVSILRWTSGALSYPGVYKFGVRTHDAGTGLTERNVDVVVTVRLDGSGVDITLRPDPPTSVSARARSSGSVKVEWTYQLNDISRVPTGFRVYKGTGGTPNYASVAATVAYSSGVMYYSATLTGLVDATEYAVGVRAYNATDEEANTMTATVTADSTAPAAPWSLSGESVS